jgi:AraC-like DNA-binding protein
MVSGTRRRVGSTWAGGAAGSYEEGASSGGALGAGAGAVRRRSPTVGAAGSGALAGGAGGTAVERSVSGHGGRRISTPPPPRFRFLLSVGSAVPMVTTLAELAAPLGVSPFHLARLFRRVTGSSIHQYRLELRLREAHGRLLDGERDLTALALDLGFADHAHFANAFRRRYGAPPSRVRGARRRSATLAPGATRRERCDVRAALGPLAGVAAVDVE